jgi:acylphosphatase
MVARTILVTGRVQGVFFRDSTKRMADELGVKGWVRNTEDGAVEIHAEGTEDALKELEQWCREGPPAAKVEKVKRSDATVKGYSDFSIRIR